MIFLLVIIYVTFISLGLPDALLGSAWPSMYQTLGVPIAHAGIISMIISGGTILSSFISGKTVRRLGVGMTSAISVAMTAIALVGISFTGNFWILCLWAIPLGLGAGSVDSAINNFVALHYEAKHMNWLHCFWGVGASIGPVIMSFALGNWQSWNMGYRIIGIFQVVLVIGLFLAIPLWKKATNENAEDENVEHADLSFKQILALPAAKATLLAFFCYCAIEATVGLWGSSYLVIVRNIPKDMAASFIALYYFGITLGRFLSGFLAIKFKNKQMIYLGLVFIALGIAVLSTTVEPTMLLMGLSFIGLGCAPIFPSLLHETPNNFGASASQAMMGVQMGCAYIGTTLMPPLFGWIASKLNYQLFPFFIGALLLLMVAMVTFLFRRVKL